MPVAIQRAFLFALLALPWLFPFTNGPVTGALPWLFAAAMLALALTAWPAGDAGLAARAAAWGWLAAALASSVIALLQYFDLETWLYPWVNIAAPGQAFGNLRQTNHLASLLVIGLLALRWLMQDLRAWARFAAPLAALLVTALAATASRTGLAELLVCGALALWWEFSGREPGERQSGYMRRVLLAAGGVLAVYALAALALPLLMQLTEGVSGRDLVERMRTAEGTCGSRLILWPNMLHLISLKPWTGWGWGDLPYAHFITLYDGPRFCYIVDNAHNLPLHLAVTLGVPVAIAAFALLAWLVWRGRPWAERQPARQLAWGVLLAIGVHSLFEYPLWYGPFQIAALICVWLLWATRARATAAGGAAAAARGWPRYLASVALLAAVAYAGWDYFRISQVYMPPEKRAALYGYGSDPLEGSLDFSSLIVNALLPYREDPLEDARKSWLFADVVLFAEVVSQPVTRDNAGWMLPAALQTMHYSPEPRVITRVIESATYLGRDDLALEYLRRFKAAFARDHRQWAQDNLHPPGQGASAAASESE